MAGVCPHGCRRCALIEQGIDPGMPLGPKAMMALLVEPPPDPGRLVYSDATLALALDVETLRLGYEAAHRQVGEAMLAVSDASSDAERRDAEARLTEAQARLAELEERLAPALVARTEAMRRESALHAAAVYEPGQKAQREAGEERSSTSRLQRLKGRRS